MSPKKVAVAPATPVAKDAAGVKSPGSAKAAEQSSMIGYLKYHAGKESSGPDLNRAYSVYSSLKTREEKTQFLLRFQKDKTCKFQSSFSNSNVSKQASSSAVTSGLMTRFEIAALEAIPCGGNNEGWETLVDALISEQGLQAVEHPSGLRQLQRFSYVKAGHHVSASTEEHTTSFQDDADISRRAIEQNMQEPATNIKSEHPRFDAFQAKLPPLQRAMKSLEKEAANLRQSMAMLKVSKKQGAQNLLAHAGPGLTAMTAHLEEVTQFICMMDTLVANEIQELELETHEAAIAMYMTKNEQFAEAVKATKRKVKGVLWRAE